MINREFLVPSAPTEECSDGRYTGPTSVEHNVNLRHAAEVNGFEQPENGKISHTGLEFIPGSDEPDYAELKVAVNDDACCKPFIPLAPNGRMDTSQTLINGEKNENFANAMALYEKRQRSDRRTLYILIAVLSIFCVISVISIALAVNNDIKNQTMSTEARVIALGRTEQSISSVVESLLQDINAIATNISNMREDLRRLHDKTEQLGVTNAQQQVIIDELTKSQTITLTSLENVESIQKIQLQELEKVERLLNDLQKLAEENASKLGALGAGNRQTEPFNLLWLFLAYILVEISVS